MLYYLSRTFGPEAQPSLDGGAAFRTGSLRPRLLTPRGRRWHKNALRNEGRRTHGNEDALGLPSQAEEVLLISIRPGDRGFDGAKEFHSGKFIERKFSDRV